jgi:hypothetical protein
MALGRTGHSGGMSRRMVVAVAMWLGGAVLAVVGVTVALNLLGSGIFGASGQVLSQADVQRDLAAQRPAAGSAAQPGAAPTAGPRGSQSPRPAASGSPASVPGEFHSTGGIVLASCSAGRVTLTSLIPMPGYEVTSHRGPAASAWVEFRSGGSGTTVTATCAGGQPHFAASAGDNGGGDDHGGGGGGSGGGSGRGSGSGH